MDKKIKKIIAKVRELLEDEEKLKPLLEKNSRISLYEENGELKIFKIEIGYYDNVVITEEKTYFRPERGGAKTLIKYGSYEELLKMKKSNVISIS